MNSTMSAVLDAALKKYSLHGDASFLSHLRAVPHETLVKMFFEMAAGYICDRNSSTLREYITAEVAGYTHNPNKTGADGHKTLGSTIVGCEVKPKSIRKQEWESYLAGQRKKPDVWNGGGGFSDYTWKRLTENKKENLDMLVSGFTDGRLIFILRFPFDTPSFIARLEEKLRRRFPNGDEPGIFCHNAEFDYRHYIESATLVFRADNLEDFEPMFNRKFYKKLAEIPRENRLITDR